MHVPFVIDNNLFSFKVQPSLDQQEWREKAFPFSNVILTKCVYSASFLVVELPLSLLSSGSAWRAPPPKDTSAEEQLPGELRLRPLTAPQSS